MNFGNLKNSIVNNPQKYAIYNPHTLEPVLIEENVIQIITIDPAIKTCAFRVAEKNLETKKIRTVIQELFDFRCTENEFATPGTTYYTNTFEILNKYKQYFRKSHYIIMEHQCSRASYNVIRMSQQILSYILMTVKNKGNRPLIIEIDARLKSSMLSLPKMKKNDLKKKCLEYAIEILTKRGEFEILDKLKKMRKKDDIGDSICYEFIWWKILKRDSELLCFKKKT